MESGSHPIKLKQKIVYPPWVVCSLKVRQLEAFDPDTNLQMEIVTGRGMDPPL